MMLRVLGFTIRTIIKLKVILVSVAAGMGIAFGLRAREQSRTWGLVPGDAERSLPGDDLVATPDHGDTRSLVIDAPPARVWPWLVRMGGEAGWYSYGFLDRPWSPLRAAMARGWHGGQSERRLEVGDVVRIQPDGGFVARIVEPEHALVLYLDDDIVREQAQALLAAKAPGAAARVATEMQDMPGFRATWALILEPETGDRTRLIGRFRVSMELAAQQRRLLPLMGLGSFALMRSQMLGIQRRAEEGRPPTA
jgi:hypothetical protein